MIQRIQSLYLLIGALALVAVFLFDAAWPGGETDVPGWMPIGLVIPVALALLSTVWALLLYGNRNRQHKVVLYAQVLTIASIVTFLYALWQAGELAGLLSGPGGAGRVIAVLLPFVAYVLFLLARKAIERDIELVRSIDRLR